MKRLSLLYILVAMLIASEGFGQVGERVSPVKILNMYNDTVSLPLLGQKNLLIFYADPSHPGQNKTFRQYFKTHPINSSYVDSYGIVNLAAAPLIPNSIIRKRALKEIQGTDAHLYFDPDEALSTAWKLPGANNNFTIIFVNKDQVIEFYKAGQLTEAEQQQVLDLIKKYER